MKKRLLSIILSLFLLAACTATLFLSGCTSSSVSDLTVEGSDGEITLSATQSSNKVDVTVRLTKNSGINAMNLTLAYDTDVLTLTGLDEGKALSSLNLITTNTKTEKGYAITPFKFDYLNATQNDTSTGVMFTLHFSVKKGAKGNTAVGLQYEDGKITAMSSGGLVKKRFAVKPAVIALS